MANPNDQGQFLSTTFIFDVAQIAQADVNSPEFKELLIRLYLNINQILLTLNTKIGGYYVPQEFVTGSLYPPLVGNQAANYRQEYRVWIDFGALPNAGTKTVAHNIPLIGQGALIYACATDPVAHKYIPIPYASVSATANNIECYVDNTNVTIITGIDYSSYTRTMFIFAYLKE